MRHILSLNFVNKNISLVIFPLSVIKEKKSTCLLLAIECALSTVLPQEQCRQDC